MPEALVRDIDASIAMLNLLSRAAKRRVIISLVLCLVGLTSAVGSAIFNRKWAATLREAAGAAESLRQTNDELAAENARLQSALFELQDADARLMQSMNRLRESDRRLQNAGAQLLNWDRELKVRLRSCLQ